MTDTADPKTATRAIAARSTQLAFTIREEMALTTVAEVFLRSGLFPDVKAAQQAMVKILAGREMGYEPVQAMMSLQIVEGRITMSAEAMAARVASSPWHRYRVTEATTSACEIVFQERQADDRWDTLGVSRFTTADAEQAGLCKVVDGKVVARSAKGYKLPWEAHTRNLLFARAMSNGFRWFTPHLKLPSLSTVDEAFEIADQQRLDGAPSTGAADLEAALSAPTPAQQAAVDAEFTEPQKTQGEGEPESPDGPPAPETSPGESAPSGALPGPAPAANSPSPITAASDVAPAPVWPDDGPGGAEAAPPGQITNLRDFQALCAAYKSQLGEALYHKALQPYGGKSNNVRPSLYSATVAALQAACEDPEGPPFPCLLSFRQTIQLGKAELQEGIAFLEGKCSVGTSLRSDYLGDAGLDKSLVIALRVYYGRLLDMYTDVQETVA